MFLVHALEKWRLQMMLARKIKASPRASQCLQKNSRFLLGRKGGGGEVFAERNVTQEEGSREQT